MAGDTPTRADSGRADTRHRHRGEDRGAPHHRGPGGGRTRHHLDFQRPAGSAGDVRSSAGDARGPLDGRVQPRAGDRRISHVRGDGTEGRPRVTFIARQRELSLVVVMLVLAGFVFWQAPQFLSAANLSQVAILAAIIAIAATGQALVVLTRNVDLSLDATIGLVAFSVADVLRTHTLSLPLAMLYGIALGLGLGILNGVIVSLFRVP